MIHSQNVKVVAITPPEAIRNNSSWVTLEVDSSDFDYAQFYCLVGSTDIALTALKVQEFPASGGAGAADVPGLIFGTSTNTDGSLSTLPSATDDNKIFAFDVDLRGRKRYLDLVATIGSGATGGFLVAWAVLSRGLITPMTAAQRGIAQVLRA